MYRHLRKYNRIMCFIVVFCIIGCLADEGIADYEWRSDDEIIEMSDTISLNQQSGYDYWDAVGFNDAREMLGTEYSSDCVIAVIDTGADLTHPGLVNNLWKNDKEANGFSGVDDDGDGYVDDIYGVNLINTDNQPLDDTTDSHGTHVSGIIAMSDIIDGLGMNCKIMVIKAGNYAGKMSEANAIRAVEYAVNHDADIINMSFGTNVSTLPELEPVIEAASKKCVVVAASGNKGLTRFCYPAAFDEVTAVMSYDEEKQVASYSNISLLNKGIIAPGSNIYSTTRNGNYGVQSGTSMSTPMVSAAYAVVLTYLEQKYNYQDITQRINIAKEAVESSGETVQYIDDNGMVHSFKALNIYKSLQYIDRQESSTEVDETTSDETDETEKESTNKAESETEQTTEHVAAKKPQLKITGNISVKSNVSKNYIKVSYGTVKNAKKYQIYRAEKSNGSYKLVKTTTAKSYIDYNIRAGTTYYYKIKAVGTSQFLPSNLSKSVKCVILKAPVNVIKNTGKRTIKVDWSPVSGRSGYRISVAKTKNGTYRTTKYTAKRSVSLSKNTKYRYVKIQVYKTINGKRYYGKSKIIRIK